MSPSTNYLEHGRHLGATPPSPPSSYVHAHEAIPLAMITMRKSTHGFPFFFFLIMYIDLDQPKSVAPPQSKINFELSFVTVW